MVLKGHNVRKVESHCLSLLSMEGPKVRKWFLKVELRRPSEQRSSLVAQTASDKTSGCLLVLCLPWSGPIKPQNANSSYTHRVTGAVVRDKARDTGKKMKH